MSAMQWRVMVVVSRSQQLAVHQLATSLAVHPFTATRLCDQLVGKGLFARHDHPADRRYLILTLTTAGQNIVDQVNADRTRDIETILDRLPQVSASRSSKPLPCSPRQPAKSPSTRFGTWPNSPA